MKVYIITIFLVSFLTLIYDFINIDVLSTENKSNVQVFNFLLLVITFGILIFTAGFRYEVGTDYWQYRLNYSNYVITVWESIKTFSEPGINVLAYVSTVLKLDYVGMFLLASIITVGLSLYTISRSTDWLFISVLLYILIGSWHGSFNGVRQFLAVSVLFYGHKYILQQEFIKYAVIVFIAASFHISAIFFIFLYFIPQRKLSKKEILFLVVVGILGLYAYETLFGLMGVFKGLIGIDFQEFSYLYRKISIFRILIAVGPIILYMTVYNSKKISRRDYFYINMLIINMIIFIASYNSAQLNRFSLYTNIYTTLGLPVILKRFKNGEKYLLIFIILILYFVFWYLEIVKTQNLYNFKWIFNN